jgi:hypothetical protein
MLESIANLAGKIKIKNGVFPGYASIVMTFINGAF